jgi:hypothetical protein
MRSSGRGQIYPGARKEVVNADAHDKCNVRVAGRNVVIIIIIIMRMPQDLIIFIIVDDASSSSS